MTKTVATQEYKDLALDQVITINFDRERAFWRSIKVFLFAYTGYEDYCKQLYDQKFKEYMDSMKDLYEIPNPNMANEAITINELMGEGVSILVGIKRLKVVMYMVKNLRVVLSIDSTVSDEMPLRMDSEEQDQCCEQEITYPEFARYKSENKLIKYQLFGDDWVDEQGELYEFSIGFREISAEGFEDWFYFGRGVHCLIKIIFVGNELNPNQSYLSDFHLQTLCLMAVQRYLYFNRMRTTIDKLHKTTANKSKITYIRKRVDPTSEMAFWSTDRSLEQLMQRIRIDIVEKGSDNYSQIGQLLGRTVKFIDLQIPMNFEDEFEDTVCLCSEWCNWNAFFHFNPIYRILMVNHNQIYLKDKTNIADMYLFSATGVLLTAQMTYNPGHALAEKVPILQLIIEANKYKQTNYNRFFMRQNGWRKIYQKSKPSFILMNGISYKTLRESIIISEVIIQLSTDPFADICCETLINYYKVLSDLHRLVSKMDLFVPQDSDSLKKWFKELDKISREDFYIYIVTSYNILMSEPRIGYDFLFSEDYEYSDIFIQTEEEKEIKQERDMILRFGAPQNPMNIRVYLEPLVTTFTSIYKLITKFEPMLPTAHSSKPLLQIYNFYRQFDTDFVGFSNNNDFDFTTDYEVMATDPTQWQHFKHYYVFYTLKLYSMAFGIQKNCITSVINYNKRCSVNYRDQVCPLFTFIWDNVIIENKFRTAYQEFLFEIPNDIGLRIDDFYNNFWGQSAHEMAATTATFQECIDSGYMEYQRLYFWWKDGGEKWKRFKRILDVFIENQVAIGNRTQQIFSTYIMRSIISIGNYVNFIEVFDVLVYYLLKAYSSMILDTISTFMKALHTLQVNELVDNNTSYTLSKPGWVPLFRTMYQTFDRLNQILPRFVVFDDENERIVNTISRTRSLVKDIYRDFYQKLSFEFQNELVDIYNLRPCYRPCISLICLHMVSGIGFLSAFIDDFRQESQYYRKILRALLDNNPDPQLHQQTVLHISRVAITPYLRDRNAIREAKPFLCSIWRNLFGTLFQPLDQKTAQDLNILINEKDFSF